MRVICVVRMLLDSSSTGAMVMLPMSLSSVVSLLQAALSPLEMPVRLQLGRVRLNASHSVLLAPLKVLQMGAERVPSVLRVRSMRTSSLALPAAKAVPEFVPPGLVTSRMK